MIVADRSAAVRAVLRRTIAAEPGLEVVGEASEGRELVRLARSAEPAAVVMDVDLPGLGEEDGGFGSEGPPIVVVTSLRDPLRTSAAFRFLRRRIVAVYAKPTTPARWEAFGQTLREILKQVGRARSDERAGGEALDEVRHRPLRLVAIGASAGGPAALAELLSAFDGRCPARMVVVQHIAAGFEVALARWLASDSGLDVQLARAGERLECGSVRLAPSSAHLRVGRSGVVHLDRGTPASNGHRPSADVLFRSLLDHDPAAVAAVLLSGMGSDGVAGMDELRRAGALTLVQSEATCAIWGMPRAALERGAARVSLAPVEIAGVVRRLADEGCE